MDASTSTPQEGNVIVNLEFVLSVLASGNCTLFSTETARHRYEVQRLAGVDRFSYRITDDDEIVEDDDVVSLADIKRLARDWPVDGWSEGDRYLMTTYRATACSECSTFAPARSPFGSRRGGCLFEY